MFRKSKMLYIRHPEFSCLHLWSTRIPVRPHIRGLRHAVVRCTGVTACCYAMYGGYGMLLCDVRELRHVVMPCTGVTACCHVMYGCYGVLLSHVRVLRSLCGNQHTEFKAVVCTAIATAIRKVVCTAINNCTNFYGN